jgi:tetratricopeptide (TPR) repeat protein/predicted aspartyl protease
MDDRPPNRGPEMTARPPLRPPSSALARACALAALGLAASAAVYANCQVQTLELPVKMVGSRAVATVGINGTPVPLTVDSGAFFSFLTDAAAAQLSLRKRWLKGMRIEGLTGEVEADLTTVDKLQLLGGDIPDVHFIVGGNEPGAGTMGLMGRNLLSFTDTEYDLAHGAIRFLLPNDDCARSNMAYWAGSTPVTEIELLGDYSRSKTPSIRARVKLEGKELVALFDTGATTIVTARAAKGAGVAEADMKPLGTMYGAGRGSARTWTARFQKFELGGEAVLNNDLQVGDYEPLDKADMLLGIDFFLSHRIYVSKQQRKMFVTYNGGTVFARNRSESAGAVAFDADPAASGASAAATADQLARRGAASAARREYESALADLDRASELEPTNAAFFAQRGALHAELKRFDRATEDLDKALKLDPALTDARFQRASLRFRAKNGEGALADLDALDKTLAPQAQMRLAMSRLYQVLEQPARALTQLNQWLPAHPNEVRRDTVLNARCWLRATLGIELEKALDDCSDALDSNRRNPAYLDSRGWVYLRLGAYRKALSDFDRSIEVRPESAWTLYGRALTKTRLGQAAQGEADLAAARKVQHDIDQQVARVGLPTMEGAVKP